MDPTFYKNLVANFPTGCLYLRAVRDPDGRICDYQLAEMNQAFELITGLTAQAAGRRASQVFPGHAAPGVWWSCVLDDAGQPAASSFEREFYSPDSGCYFRLTSLEPAADDLFVFATDITREVSSLQEKNAILSVLNDIVLVLDEEFVFLQVFTSDDRFLFVPREQIVGHSLHELFPPDLAAQISGALRQARRQGRKQVITYASPAPGDERWFQAELHYTEGDQLRRYIANVSDITDQQRSGQVVRLSEEKYRFIAEHTSDVIWVLNLGQRGYMYVSQAIIHQTGFTPEEMIGRCMDDFLTPESMATMRVVINAGLDLLSRQPEAVYHSVYEVQKCCKDAAPIWVQDSISLLYNAQHEVEIVGVSRSIEERKRVEALERLSYHDQLTGLYNRSFFDQIIDPAMERSDRYNEPLSMAIIDLDHFKQVNDTYGHPVGDEVLKQVAQSLGRALRSSDVLLRFGGEEFIVLMPQTTLEGALCASEKVRQAVEQTVHATAGVCTASVGVAERMHSESFQRWYRRMDQALYRAKQGGRNQVVASDGSEAAPSAYVNIAWRSEWNSGHRGIDRQHQELVRVANRLIELALAGCSYEETMPQLELLLEHVTRHFRYEEKVLSELGYPGADRHGQVHKALLARASYLYEAYRRKEIRSSAFFSFVVDDVMLGHMLGEDTQFFPYTRGE
ncbi:MAG: diguanylate cyclase [Chloroflexota bacterium]